jgi:hypothetical protein
MIINNFFHYFNFKAMSQQQVENQEVEEVFVEEDVEETIEGDAELSEEDNIE